MKSAFKLLILCTVFGVSFQALHAVAEDVRYVVVKDEQYTYGIVWRERLTIGGLKWQFVQWYNRQNGVRPYEGNIADIQIMFRGGFKHNNMLILLESTVSEQELQQHAYAPFEKVYWIVFPHDDLENVD